MIDHPVPALLWQNMRSILTWQDDWQSAFSYTQWAGHSGKLDSWKSGCPEYLDFANTISGTEGLQFRPLLEEDTILPVFSQDILRYALCAVVCL